MTERDKVYVGALLHDIGKFIERAKLADWQARAEQYVKNGDADVAFAHKRYSAALIDEFKSKKTFLSEAVAAFALWHHRGNDPSKKDYDSINSKGVLLKLIRIADDCASAERKDDAQLEPQKYYLARLQSAFSDVEIDGKRIGKPAYLNLYKLSQNAEALFQGSSQPAFEEREKSPYEQIVKEFIQSFEKIESEEELLFLLEKFCHSTPAQTPVTFQGKERLSKPDINLYDHLRSTAAIALCLYDEYVEGSWKGKDEDILNDSQTGYKRDDFPAPCLLIAGDVSGIQNFIFSIASKGAARALKGRSFFVQLLSEVAAQFVLDELNLKAANLLFNGGGNFYILAPACKEEKLKKCKEKLEEAFLKTDLYISLAWEKVTIQDFRPQREADFPEQPAKFFTEKWQSVKEKLQLQKQSRFKSLEFEKIFSPTLQLPNDKEKEQEDFKELTERLRRAKGYAISKKEEREKKMLCWEEPIEALGYEVKFFENDSYEGLALNQTNFEKRFKGFRFAVKDLPTWTKIDREQFLKACKEKEIELDLVEDPIEVNYLLSFDHLALKAELDTGTGKIAVLKMDVDNLGKLFKDGLPKELRTVSRVAAISRSMKWFFEGYMNTLLRSEPFRNYIYPIFSGGDDFFVVGSWHKVFDFALKVNDEFQRFVCYHPKITLSAGLIVVDRSYPVARFAELVEERLSDAKTKSKEKNAISVFDIVLSWPEFAEARRLKEIFVELITRYNQPKAVLQKVLQSTEGLPEVLKSLGSKKRIDLKRYWMIAYSLREIKGKGEDEKPVKEMVRKIVGEYERLLSDALVSKDGSKVKNPMLVAVAARWAEFETRGFKPEPQAQEK